MTVFPCAKINLGLNVTARRADGYHDLETVFYPLPLCDALEIHEMDEVFPSDLNCDLKITGAKIDCEDADNLVVKAYDLLSKDYVLPRVHAHLRKQIPSQAGLGGGSTDAAFMIRLLDERCGLNIGNAEMERYAAKLGADCAFFITTEPAFATGIGDVLEPVEIHEGLKRMFIAIVKPPVAVSTREAYQNIVPRKPQKSCRDIVAQPVTTWREELTNDFEQSVFSKLPELKGIKNRLYELGAVYAQMSGSGSALFGLFEEEPTNLADEFKNCFTFTSKML